MPVDLYLAGFPEGRDGFCDHCHLHQRYCSLGNRAPPLVIIEESSQDTDINPDNANILVRNETAVQNGKLSHQLPKGHVSSSSSTNGDILMSSPPTVFRSVPVDVDDDLIVILYEALSASATRAVHRRGLLQTSPATPGSPMASARYMSRRQSHRSENCGKTSSLSRPPGFSNSATTHSTAVFQAAHTHSLIFILRLPVDERPISNGLVNGGMENLFGGTEMEEDLEEKPDMIKDLEPTPEELAEEVPLEMAVAVKDQAIHNNMEAPLLPAFGLQLFAGLEDDDHSKRSVTQAFWFPRMLTVRKTSSLDRVNLTNHKD